jgi:hypothetical protein
MNLHQRENPIRHSMLYFLKKGSTFFKKPLQLQNSSHIWKMGYFNEGSQLSPYCKMLHSGVSYKSTLKIESTILSETRADLYSNMCFHIPSNRDLQFNCRMQCLSRITIFQSKTGPRIQHKMQMAAHFKKNIKYETCSLSPSNVCCYSRIQSTQDTSPFRTKFCTSSNSLCPVTSQSVTCISPQISKRLQVFSNNPLSLIYHHITVHNSSTIISDLFSFNHYAM